MANKKSGLLDHEYRILGKILEDFIMDDEVTLGEKKIEFIYWIINSNNKGLIGNNLNEIASESGVGASTVHSALKTLEKNDFVFKDGKAYYLNFKKIKD